MVAYEAFAFEGGGGWYSPSGVTCNAYASRELSTHKITALEHRKEGG
jgi:hypothetical protein